MLSSIHIENIALIESLDLELPSGFSVFTGETGAGKSIIIDSIGLILGNRGERELVRTGTELAVVEAMFTDISAETEKKLSELGVSLDEDKCLFVKRTLSADGKSTAKIGTRTVPASLLREIAVLLVNIHGQHHNSVLLDSEKHLSILDEFGETDCFLEAYKKEYERYSHLNKELSSLSIDTREKERRVDMLKFQIREIKSAKLKAGEDAELASEKKRLRNFEKITIGVQTVYSKLYDGQGSATESIDKALNALKGLENYLPESKELYQKLYEYRYEIEDIAERAKDSVGDINEDPESALDRVETRLETISKLKSKYGATIEEILSYCEKCEEELEEIEFSDERRQTIEKELEKCTKVLSETAEKLSSERHEKAKLLSMQIEKELGYLDMNGVGFEVRFEKTDFKPDGNDFVEFYVSTNAGEPGKPVGKIASGGELARIMLAIKSVISEKDSIETMIYDEVDTGVSGKTSRKLGARLKQSATGKQVLCVTHSAQIASLANTHFLVSKKTENGRTRTSIFSLDGSERIEETARILAGINITDTARSSAKELIESGLEQI